MSAPSWRQRLKPLELVGLAAVLGVFAGVIALVGTRSLEIALILAGIAFIVALLVLAMLALAAGDEQEPDETPILQRETPPRRKRR